MGCFGPFIASPTWRSKGGMYMRRIFWIFVLVLGLSFSLSMADPEGGEKGVSKGKSTTQKKTKADDQAAEGRAFGKDQEKINHNGFSDKTLDGLPPGLAKREQLPPGLQKDGKVPPGHAKRDQLPPGLQKDGKVPPGLQKDGIVPPGLQRQLEKNETPSPDLES